MKYDLISTIQLESYKKDLINRVFKILPLKECKCATLTTYINSIIYELCGAYRISNSGAIIALISTLEMLKEEENHSTFKQKVFQCTNEIIPLIFKGVNANA